MTGSVDQPPDNKEEVVIQPAEPPHRYPVWPWVLAVVGIVLTGIVVYPFAYDRGVNDERARVAAAAEAKASLLPPDDLFCPDASSEDARKAIRDLPVVVIDKPAAQPIVVMRRDVVVVVKAVITGDLIICGNDAKLAFEVAPRPSARVLMQGGTNTQSKTAGPMVFAVDAIPIDAQRVWFSNKNPQIVNCRGSAGIQAGKMRPCTSYYSTALPPAPKPSR